MRYDKLAFGFRRSRRAAMVTFLFASLVAASGLVLTLPRSLADEPDEIGEMTGEPWKGEPGITETVQQLMDRDYLFPVSKRLREAEDFDEEPEPPDRSGLPQAPDSLGDTPTWPVLPAGVPAVTPRSPYQDRNPQTITTNFLGVPSSESGFIPPDTMGDVSPTQILVFANGRIKVFDRNGALGGLNVTANNFFNSVRNASTVSDPRVVWDRLTSRWFVAAINVTSPNRILIAVSSGATISNSSSFTFFQFTQDAVGTTPNADTGALADYPSLGVDNNALYVGCNMFTSAYIGTSGWVIRKSDLLVGTLTVTAFRQMATAAGEGPYAPRGVTNDDPASTQGYFIGSSNNGFGRLTLRRVSTPGSTPTLSANITVSVPSTANPFNPPAQGSTTNPEGSDDRLYDARIHLNRVTGARLLTTGHTIQANTSGTGSSSGGRDAFRWYQLQNMTTTPALLQSGTLFDSAAANPVNYIYGTAATTGQGHVAMGATSCGTNEFLQASVAGRLSSDTAGTTQARTIAQSSSTSYTVSASGRNRWGDYSSTIVDPADDQTMWTFQEYCSGTNAWSVRVVKLMAPPPATPTSCSPSSVAQGASNVNVIVTGASASGSAFYDSDATYTNRIAAALSGTGITLNSVTRNSDTQVTLNINVSAAAIASARTVTITNPDGQSAVSSTGILTITGGCVAPSITTQPASSELCSGGNASFSVVSGGTGPLTYQWRRGTTNLSDGGAISGATTFLLSITGASAGDAATNYNCVVTNACGSATSSNAALVVDNAPGITTQPAGTSACVGGNASFSIVATGLPTPSYQWRRGFTNLVDGGSISGANTPNLTITGVVSGDSGTYTCVLSNSCGNLTSNPASLGVSTGPAMTTQPTSLARCTGASASFTVAVSGSPFPTLQWRKNGADISGATNATYTIASVASGDAANYDCVATNSCGSVASNVAALTVQTSPSITTQPTGSTRCPGDEFTFSLIATGNPTPTFQWRLNGSNIPGATNAAYGLGSIAPGDAGTYDCVVTNTCGSVTSGPAVLVVESGPSISTQPASSSVNVGASAVFSVAATGSPTLSYQWRKDTTDLSNGGAISGADTNSLTINPAASGDAGSYDVVVSNPCGTLTSDPATLTVNSGCITDIDDGSGTGTPDGGVTIDDLLYYLFIFESGDPSADVDDGNGTGTLDGGVTIDDLLYFLFRFELGC